METLIRELEALRKKPQLTSDEVAGAMVAMTMRIRDIMEARLAGVEAIATAVAMQPHVDALKLHDDFVSCLKARFESMRLIPAVLKDIATGIKLAAAERK